MVEYAVRGCSLQGRRQRPSTLSKSLLERGRRLRRQCSCRDGEGDIRVELYVSVIDLRVDVAGVGPLQGPQQQSVQRGDSASGELDERDKCGGGLWSRAKNEMILGVITRVELTTSTKYPK